MVCALGVAKKVADLPQFKPSSNQIANISNQISNEIVIISVECFYFKSNGYTRSNRDLNPNHDWDLPITSVHSVYI